MMRLLPYLTHQVIRLCHSVRQGEKLKRLLYQPSKSFRRLIRYNQHQSTKDNLLTAVTCHFVMRGRLSVAYAFSGHCYWVRAVCDAATWRYIHVSTPTFWWSLLTQFVYSTCTLLIFCVSLYWLSSIKLGYRSKIH